MVKWLVVLVIGLFPVLGYSQFGLNIKYVSGGSDILDEALISQKGMQASVEYGFRLKKKRLEFHPGIGYRFTFNGSQHEGNITAFDMDLNTAIYPFDFEGDCDCPTWSKEGNLIKKGLFLEVSPGLSFQTINRDIVTPEDPNDPQATFTSSTTLLKLGIGMGIDIGLSDAVTLTPIISYVIFSSEDWIGLNRDGSTGTLDDQSYLGLGLRMVYKPDPKRLRRRR